jgi:hypothetical protein
MQLGSYYIHIEYVLHREHLLFIYDTSTEMLYTKEGVDICEDWGVMLIFKTRNSDVDAFALGRRAPALEPEQMSSPFLATAPRKVPFACSRLRFRHELNPLCSCLAACYIRYLGAVRMVCVKSRSKVS